MAVDVRKWIGKGLAIAPMIFEVANLVEKLIKGKDKKPVFDELFEKALEAAEGLAEKDLFNDAKLTEAKDNLVIAYVAFQHAYAAAKASKGDQ